MSLEHIHNLDDDALGQLLADTFDALPEPSATGLRKVRDGLPLSTNNGEPNRWLQIVLIGILSGSGLAFAWWGIDRIFSTQTTVQEASQSALTVPHSPDSDTGTPGPIQPGKEKQGDDRRSPIIFQQEKY